MNTTLGNTSLLFSDVIVIPNIASLILRLPVNIYILQLIISRHLITSEFYTLNEAFFEIIICLYDCLGVATHIFPNPYLTKIRRFSLGFIVSGRPCLLSLICVERYLAVVKPMTFLRIKPLKYKLALSGIIWLWTLVFCIGALLLPSAFHAAVIGQIIACCLVQLYCCITSLLVLKKPGPGEGLRQREGMSNIKLKAFRIILIITVSVILIHAPFVTVLLLKDHFTYTQFLKIINGCYLCTAFSGLVQASLFLQRCGKLPFIKWP